jgi:hypothetical protein
VHGHALIDRELYLPQSWADDRDRRRAAGIPEQVEFTTKPRQAQAMIGRAIAAGVPFAWFTADETYWQAKYLQGWLEDQDVFYVMAIRCSDTLTTSAGEQRADVLIAAAPLRAWQRLSTGAGARGPREFDWSRIPVRPEGRRGRGHWLLARRSISDPAEIAYYACYGPRPSSTVLGVAHLALDGFGEVAIVMQDAELDVTILCAPGEIRARHQQEVVIDDQEDIRRGWHGLLKVPFDLERNLVERAPELDSYGSPTPEIWGRTAKSSSLTRSYPLTLRWPR